MLRRDGRAGAVRFGTEHGAGELRQVRVLVAERDPGGDRAHPCAGRRLGRASFERPRRRCMEEGGVMEERRRSRREGGSPEELDEHRELSALRRRELVSERGQAIDG